MFSRTTDSAAIRAGNFLLLLPIAALKSMRAKPSGNSNGETPHSAELEWK
jgi:hypothetical protein